MVISFEVTKKEGEKEGFIKINERKQNIYRKGFLEDILEDIIPHTKYLEEVNGNIFDKEYSIKYKSIDISFNFRENLEYRVIDDLKDVNWQQKFVDRVKEIREKVKKEFNDIENYVIKYGI